MLAVDQTRDRILEAAEKNFRSYGYGKTTVADIAGDCQMSSANVYRFFDTKADIVAAIADKWLAEMEGLAHRVAKGNGSAADRLRSYVMGVFEKTIERYVENEKIHEMCQMVIVEQWPVVHRHIERMREIIGIILQSGVDRGEFFVEDVQLTSEAVKNTLLKFHHPGIVAECQEEPLAEQAEAVVDLLVRGLRAKPGG